MDALLERGERLIAEAPTADAKGQFYVRTLGLRFAKARGATRADTVSALRDLVRDAAGLFLQTARSGDTELFARLDSAIDRVLGQTSQELPEKGRIFGMLWGLLERCAIPGWPAAESLANNYVGQSQSGSAAERIGLRLNLGLLGNGDFITTRPAGVAPVWTQTLRIWSLTADRSSAGTAARAALGLLAALVYGGGRDWGTRAAAVWQGLTGIAFDEPPALLQHLDPDQARMLQALQADRADTAEILGEVFADDIGEPIRTVEELAAEEAWTDWPEIEKEIAELGEHHCPKTTEN